MKISKTKDWPFQLWKLGVENGFRVIRHAKGGNVDYEWAREISNSRFDLEPGAVALPKNVEQIALCIRFCNENDVAFRVRSGGHQHEGMSSLNAGLMIRLSEHNEIEYVGSDAAWIGVGKPLKEVYDELELKGKTIPGGGCWAVNVGGLTLGGGWGTSVRKMGLTCDNVIKAEIITADGRIIVAQEGGQPEDYSDLLWALKGGGGGNFGVVTRFLFRLHSIKDQAISTFNFQWKEKGNTRAEKEHYLSEIVSHYLAVQSDFPMELCTVMGLRVRHKFMKTDDGKDHYYPLGMSGKFYGTRVDLERITAEIRKKFTPDYVEFYPKAGAEATGEVEQQMHSEMISHVVDRGQMGLPELDASASVACQIEQQQLTQTPPPTTTCLAPWPHKISSGFVKGPAVYADLAKKAVGILLDSNEQITDNTARLYMVLHAMPGIRGGVAPNDTAFFWRNNNFLFQFQAWWAKHSSEADVNVDQERYVRWIENARETLADQLEGAFINFVDKNLPVEAYYGDNLPRLMQLKKKYDPSNRFRFQLSVPLPAD